MQLFFPDVGSKLVSAPDAVNLLRVLTEDSLVRKKKRLSSCVIKTWRCSCFVTPPSPITRFALLTHFHFSFYRVVIFVHARRSSALQRSLWDTFLPVSPSHRPLDCNDSRSLQTAAATSALLHRILVKLITSGERALDYLIRATYSWLAFRASHSVIRHSTCARDPIWLLDIRRHMHARLLTLTYIYYTYIYRADD